jgi:hypothetical protein
MTTDHCVDLYQDALLPFSRQRLAAAADCACPTCLRQPPSLRDVCLNAINNSRSGIIFELSVHTNFDEFKLAFKSDHVSFDLLQPPQYPNIHIRCRFRSSSFDHRYHIRCPAVGCEKFGPWSTQPYT